MDDYTMTGTASGWAVRRADGALAEFLDEEEAQEALALLECGETTEAAYEWWTPDA